MGPQTFEYLLNMIGPGREKNGVFQLKLPIVYNRSLSKPLICFSFASQFSVDHAYHPIL